MSYFISTLLISRLVSFVWVFFYIRIEFKRQKTIKKISQKLVQNQSSRTALSRFPNRDSLSGRHMASGGWPDPGSLAWPAEVARWGDGRWLAWPCSEPLPPYQLACDRGRWLGFWVWFLASWLARPLRPNFGQFLPLFWVLSFDVF